MNFSSLQQRVFSSVVMAPAVLAIIYLGGWLFAGMVLVCACIALFEWGRLSLKTDRPYPFLALGAVYIPLSLWCCYLIRTEYGISMGFLFVIMVWASDIGGYVIGKIIGGPKLAKKISPNKTWSGYAGALLFPAGFSLLYLLVADMGHYQPLYMVWIFMIGALMGITGQAGDLLVSWLKRRVNVKDTGDIIPGHGGILDRIDSLLLCAPVFFFAIGVVAGAR